MSDDQDQFTDDDLEAYAEAAKVKIAKRAAKVRGRLRQLEPMFAGALLPEESERQVRKAIWHLDRAMQEMLWPTTSKSTTC